MENAGRTISYPKGETIYRIGDAGGQMYVVMRGGIQLHSDGGSVETVQAGGVFGEHAIIEAGPRIDRAVALIDSEVIAIDTKRFLALVQSTPSFALQLMRAMATRARLRSGEPQRARGMVA